MGRMPPTSPRRPSRTGSSRAGSGPGRGSPRTRTQSRTTGRTAKDRTPVRGDERPAEDARQPQPLIPDFGLPAKLGITRRAVALIVVVAVLMVSYANSLRVYLDQERALTEANAEIVQREQEIAALNDELERWNDPDYIAAQARHRLGWVVPGDTGYRVVGADGRPIEPAAQLNTATEEEAPPPWWGNVWDSVKAADNPAEATDEDPNGIPDPEEEEPTGPPITLESPSPSATPTGGR
ncbi:hypothetical protein CGZ92_01240 [Parenemella sanctibonifatiensis]|uniref:Septum formation initiator family protein n=2 Tax=Parenemella sanctibonifatiensis TaxID=2016505 RepID=A0A255EG38_9ACTN|nr:hypothetical protein CGZ92_01240 [Parenemella sanctibonifatiensis]